ncbi:hypothetical protein MJO28_013064 [Puccinia striiformis f. sp. tritici]|uniref:Uncharacterized protein n=1 Tax=Puccinia striiformis f. sp. tritici TaxID=168172 RepID=A0ACC0DXI9_9BASI|nr:hypothetical protein MJO28_013064 [Puccinia striiformis f. sp. tritici]
MSTSTRSGSAAAAAAPATTTKEEKEIIVIPTFRGENYANWQNAMSAYLEYKSLWHVCQAEPGENPNEKLKGQMLEVWLILNSKIAPEIFTSLNSVCGRNPFKIWTKLKENYATASIYGIYRVCSYYKRINYKDDLLKYIIQIEGALAEMSTIGLDVMNPLVGVNIIEAITDKRPVLMERLLADMDTLGNPFKLLEKLRQIANHDQVRLTRDNPVQQNSLALATTTQGRRRPHPSNGGIRVSCRGGAHNPDATHEESECWTLHPDLRPKKKLRASSYSTMTQGSRQQQNEDYSYYTTDGDTRAASFILDSGASQHMFNDISHFISTEPTEVYIITGSGEDNKKMSATHRGTARLKIGTSTITLHNALFVPNLATNLISFAQLIKEKATITAKEGRMIITLNGNHTISVNTSNNLFEIEGVEKKVITALITDTRPSDSDLMWHLRLGHASSARIKAIVGAKINFTGRINCSTCMKGKMVKLPFKGSFSPTNLPLEVVHGDLVGPITPSTNSGFRYFLTLVDQHTGYIDVTLLKDKSEATAAIIEYKTKFEKQTGHSIKKLITDGGGEFCNKTLGEILKIEGIQHNVSPPYTPQHNGIAERANRTVIEMTRCNLLQTNMDAEWWGAAVKFSVITTNSLPSLSKSRASPSHLFLKSQTNQDFLRPFGCRAWILKPKANRDRKFDSVAWEGTLIGYANDLSSYQILRHEDQKVITSRQVKFEENVFPRCSAINKSHNTLATRESEPTFISEPMLPFDEAPEIEDRQTTEEDEPEDPVENHPISPETGKRWVYVSDYQPPSNIESTINETNIITGKRVRKQVCYVAITINPKSHFLAMKSPDHLNWKEAELKEINNMKKYQVWIERPRQTEDRPIASTWAYRKKLGSDNQVIEYKARICAQGFRQTFGVNFELKYAPTGKAASLRLLLSFAVNNDLQIHQLDVRSAFLTCPLDDTVTLLPPPGYECPPGTIFELQKTIYGLKQSSLVWYKRLSNFLISIGFLASLSDPCVFHRSTQPPVWIYAHVDDLVIISRDPSIFKKEIEKEFDIKYLGAASFLLGMNIDRTQNQLHVHQTQYVERKIIEFGLTEAKLASCPMNPKIHLRAASPQEIAEFTVLNVNYRALVGSLNYLSVLTRPDISYAVSVLSQHLERPGIQHFRAAQQVFRYLAGTKHVGLVFTKSDGLSFRAHVDSDWGNCPDTRRSATGYVVLTNDQTLSWKASRQATVSLSSTEAEYKALSDLGRELAWLANLTLEINLNYSPTEIPVGVDNQGAIDLARSEISQNGFRTKHMDIRLHFVRELIINKLIKLHYIRTTSNFSDFLTKPTGRCTIRRSLAAISVVSPDPSASNLAARGNPACRSSPNGAETAKRCCKENSSFDAQQHETSSQSPRAQKKATSSNAPSVATGANGEPQGKDLHSIASRITSPEIHLTSRISQRHDDLSNGAREYLRLKTKESQSSLPIPLFISLSQATSPAQIKTNVVLLLGTLPVLFFTFSLTNLLFLKNIDYNSEDPLWLFTDASGTGLGTAVFQGREWKLASPIAYESHLMTPAERNYPVHEQELLLVIHALQKWKMLLLGMKVNVMSDHHSLVYLLKQRNLSR